MHHERPGRARSVLQCPQRAQHECAQCWTRLGPLRRSQRHQAPDTNTCSVGGAVWPVGALRRQPVAPCKGPVRQIQRSADLSYGAITIFLHLGAGYAGEDKTAAQQGFGQGPGIACEGSPSAEKLVQRRRGVEMGLKRRKTPRPGCGLRVEAGTKPISVRSQNRGSEPAGLEADFSPMALFNVKTARKRPRLVPQTASNMQVTGFLLGRHHVIRLQSRVSKRISPGTRVDISRSWPHVQLHVLEPLLHMLLPRPDLMFTTVTLRYSVILPKPQTHL